MDAACEPEREPEPMSSDPNTAADALDSQSDPNESIGTVEELNDVTSGSPKAESPSSSLEGLPSPSDPSNSASEGTSTDPPADETADAAAEDDEDSAELKIPFVPGDHITRWEMLPIAWPIQVHGIVLEVHEDAVVLVDFGLAAVPKGKNHEKNRKKKGSSKERRPEPVVESESNVEESGNGEASDAKKQQQLVKKAIEKFQKGFKKERNRLNVQTLTTQKEISKWSKVNYDGGLFGFGKKDAEGNKNEDNDEQGSSDNKSSRTEKRESWWGNLMKNKEKKQAEREQRKMENNADNADITEPSTSAIDDNSIVTSTRTDSELKIESSDSSTPTNVSGCGGIPACDTPPWWCRISMQRGKRRGSTDKVSAAMLEASKNGELVQEYKRNERKSIGDTNDNDFVAELEKRQMKKSFQEDHSDYMASVAGGESVESTSPKTTADVKMDGFAKSGENNASPNGETIPDESEAFEEEKKDEHEFSYEESDFSKDKAPQLSVATDESEIDTSQTEATKVESPSGSQASASPSSKAESESDSSSIKSMSRSSSPKKDKHESKADPPAVVLARTRWLLKHGEGILPPYHAFSSNSECMAVFCKTGYWSTLQADIFLHSTAIGNAKSTVVMTLGVAASVPVLAPVVGAVGLGAIVAPWLYLDKQKKAAKETQQKLADQFWAQAEPEVIVACVKAWSNLEDKVDEETLPKADDSDHVDALLASGAGEISD